MAQILLGESISLSSVTFGMALINLIPATTFALAIAFRYIFLFLYMAMLMNERDIFRIIFPVDYIQAIY